jgi:hypothetical protein
MFLSLQEAAVGDTDLPQPEVDVPAVSGSVS